MANAKIKHLQLPNGTTYDFHAVTADSTNKLGSSNVGSATNPIYLSSGAATACTYTLGKSVPSNAVFTDTNTTYTLSADTTNNKIKLTPSNGSAQSITVPYATSAGSIPVSPISTSVEYWFDIPFISMLGGNQFYKNSYTFMYHYTSGTSDTIGISGIRLGNDKASGTEGNSGGTLELYSSGGTGYSTLTLAETDGYPRHVLPAQSGTIGVFTSTPTDGQVVVADGTKGGFKTTGYTIAKSVPSNAVFTDTNNAVTQTATSTNANYEVLFSNTADNTTRTEGARKNSNLIFNPAVGLKIGTSAQSVFPTTGIQVHDVRSVDFTPGALDQGVNFFFSNNTMPNTNWWSGIHVKGWAGAYAAWEIVGSAHNDDSRTTPLYVRSSNTNSAWGSWRKIYDTSNPPTHSEVGAPSTTGTGASGSWGISVTGSSASCTGHAASDLALSGGTMTGSITCTTSGANLKYGNITIYGGGTNGGINSMLVGDDVTIGDCNVGGCFGMKSTGNNAGFRFYNSNGTSIGGLQSTNGTLQWFNSSGTAYNVGYFTATPTSGQVVITDGTTGGIKSSGYTIAKSVPSDAVFTDTNTHRPIQVNGTEILGNNTTALNLKAGSNVSVTNSSGTVTIAATDTNTTYTLSADTTNNKITLTPSSGSAQSITVPYATSAGGVAWGNVTGKPSTFTPASHTHGIADITWAGNANLKANASANNQEWSIDLTPGSYTGTYWQVWSAKNSKTILACYTDNNKVEVPNGDFYVTNGEVAVGYGIELGMASKEAAAHIDFHWNSSTATDYTARIWQRGESTVDLIGKNGSTWGIWRAGSFSTQSSIHAKENIQDITVEDSRKLLQLRPVTFNYKNGGLTDQAGLIAEEVYLVMPKMVIGDINYNPEEPWNTPSIDYSKFVPYLIKMIQEQQKEIDELRRLVQG